MKINTPIGKREVPDMILQFRWIPAEYVKRDINEKYDLLWFERDGKVVTRIVKK